MISERNIVWNGPGFFLGLGNNGTLNDEGKLLVKIEDLNPDVQIKHRMSRMDMLKIALWFFRNAWRAA